MHTAKAGRSLKPASASRAPKSFLRQSAEGRKTAPELPLYCLSPALSSQMAGYNGEAGRSFNENIYCELQNKTQTPTGPDRREDSLGFRLECRGSERLASGALMANVEGPRSSWFLCPGTACTSASLTGKSLSPAPHTFQSPRFGHSVTS